MTDAPLTDADSFVWEQRHRLLYQIDLSVSYHLRRAWFLNHCDCAGKFAAVLAGSAAIVPALPDRAFSGLMISAAVFAGASLIWKMSERVREHRNLAERFQSLKAAVERAGFYPALEQLAEWRGQLADIEKTEPHAKIRLIQHLQNKIARREGQGELVRKLPLWQRPFVDLLP